MCHLKLNSYWFWMVGCGLDVDAWLWEVVDWPQDAKVYFCKMNSDYLSKNSKVLEWLFW